MPLLNACITSAHSLVTTHEETRAGFSIALEKNQISNPYVQNALAFKATTSHLTRQASDLLRIAEIRPFLITAAGLSERSLSYLDEADRTLAIKELIEKFLEPTGTAYIDEAT